MMDDVVVVLRNSFGEELIGSYISDEDEKVKIQNPYFLRYVPSLGDVIMSPYCMYSDETYFEFKKSDLQYLVTANELCTKKYLQFISEDDYNLPSKTFIAGNDTKH